MALRTAKAFKNFLIDSNLSQGVFFGMDTPIDISVKCDNFAEQVQVHNVIEAINLFEYKYITFDGKTVFEITDCLQCDDYYTLFITLLSRVKLEQWDSDFLFTHQTHSRLRALGFSFTKWVEILGGTTKFQQEINNLDVTGWGVVVELSALPQNIGAYRVLEVQRPFAHDLNWKANRHGLGKLVYNPQTPLAAIGGGKFGDCVATARTYSFVLPIPIGQQSKYIIRSVGSLNTATLSINLRYQNFIAALEALVNDLTVSITIIPLTARVGGCVGIVYAGNNDNPIYQISATIESDGSVVYSQTYVSKEANAQATVTTVDGGWVDMALCAIKDYENVYINYPLMLLDFGIASAGLPDPNTTFNDNVRGFVLIYNFLKIDMPNMNSANKAIVALSLLGNVIEYDTKMGGEFEVYLKYNPNGIRVYLNYDMNVYEDIENTIEFSASAFSNYQAYSKSNLELVQSQQYETLKLQQQQDEKTQNLKFAQSSIGAFSQAGQAGAQAAMGGPFAAIGAAASSLANSAISTTFDKISFNQKQQNERANLILQQDIAKNVLRETIARGTEKQGAVKLENLFKYVSALRTLSFYTITLDDWQVIYLYEYLISNKYLERINFNGKPVVPNYIPAGKPVQCMFTASPITNNKSFVALCKPLPQS